MKVCAKLFIIFIIFLIPFGAIQGQWPAQAAEKAVTSPTDEYRVGPGDVIEINVYKQDELQKVIKIPPDGNILFPLIGEVMVADLTTREIAQKIRARLEKDYLYNPQVIVSIVEYKSKKVFVLGGVKNPGEYYLMGPTRILDILTKAGAVSLDEKRGGKITIKRKLEPGSSSTGDTSTGAYETIVVDIFKMLVEADDRENIYLQPGDSIYVPDINTFYIFGEVDKPGKYELDKDCTLLRAITIAGGFTLWAKKNIFIKRKIDGQETQIKVDVDDILEGKLQKDVPILPQDIIVVPKRWF